MDDKIDLQERQPEPEETAPAPRRRLTAVEVRKKHGIRLAIFLALFCWFAYDGWVNPKYQAPDQVSTMWFNKIGAGILAVVVVYHAGMFVSAAIAVTRQRESGEVELPPEDESVS